MVTEELLCARTETRSPPAAQPTDELNVADARASITWLIDNADAYRALLAACDEARASIWISQLAFDADCQVFSSRTGVTANDASCDVRLADAVLAAAETRGVEVRMLLNASLLLDTVAPLRDYARAAGADPLRVRIRGVSRFPQLLHAKVVVVDGAVAFLIGSPFVNGYWDDSRHAPIDRRRPQRELGGRPLHDLSTRFTGPGVLALAAWFAEQWNGADDVMADDGDMLEAPAAASVGGGLAEPAVVRIVATAPEPRHPRHPRGRTEILDELLAGIAEARSLIYVEQQYVSSRRVVAALGQALEREPALEILMVLNQNPDVTAYRGWQNALLAESGLSTHPRVGLFCLWTVDGAGRSAERALNQLFVHSKVVAVDDRWAMVGSANVDGVSLHSYGDDFSGWVGRRVFRDVRNFDVSAVVCGARVGEAVLPAVLELRTALWREHLSQPSLDVATPPAGGWLGFWRRRAAECVAWCNTPQSASEARILILPYSREDTPARQLRDVGVVVASGGLQLCFDPSWMEVHVSPNWVRNMFAR
jgi:phosphatidylserine/phosphatidylglycerophosphate/cardiolipin synthase-like enzyme